MKAYERKDRPGTWRAEAVLDGRRHVVNASSRTEAERLLRLRLRATSRGAAGGSVGGGASRTLGAYLASWLAAKQGTIRPSTEIRYAQLAKLLVGDELLRTRLDKLTAARLTDAFTRLSKAGKGAASIQRLRTMLGSALSDAIPEHLAHNPIPKSKAPRHEPRETAVPTVDEIKLALEAAKDTGHAALFVIAIGAGLRVGELLALRWSDVHEDRIEVTHQLDHKGKLAPLKTRASRRTIAIGSSERAALHAQRRVTGTGAFVFATSTGTPLDRSNFRRQVFDPIVGRAGLARRFTPHGFFRHGAATFLISQGVDPRTVKDRLGHANISTTLGIYTRGRGQDAALDALAGLFSSPGNEEG